MERPWAYSKCSFEIPDAEIMSPEDISWITLWPEWQQKQKLCWCVQFLCLDSMQNKPEVLTGATLLRIFFILKVQMEREWFHKNPQNVKKNEKHPTQNLLLNDYVMLK